MALSYYSNWDSFPQWDSDLVGAIDDPELQSLHDTWKADYSVDLNDLFFPPAENLNYCCNSSSLLPLPYSEFNNGGLPFHEFDSFDYYLAKRQRLCYSDPCLAMLQPEIPPEFNIGRVVKKEESAGGLSAQSMAARQRRRRITVKTQELGKQFTGGQKMNTAKMLHSAHKYIRFMQAQLALLQSLTSSHQEVTFEGEDELQKLLESPLIQEKLYSTENCLLPSKYTQQLGCEPQLLKSSPYYFASNFWKRTNDLLTY